MDTATTASTPGSIKNQGPHRVFRKSGRSLKNRGRLGPRFHNCAGVLKSNALRYPCLTISSSFSFYIWSHTVLLNKSRNTARLRSITASHKNRERTSKLVLITSRRATGLDSKKSFLLFSSQCATHRTLPINERLFSFTLCF